MNIKDFVSRDIRKHNFSKLSEVLVPLSTVEKMIRLIEDMDEFSFNAVDGKGNDVKNDTYVFPYSFIRNAEDKEELETRVEAYYRGYLNKESMDHIDNSNSIIVLIFTRLNIIVPLDVNNIDNIQVIDQSSFLEDYVRTVQGVMKEYKEVDSDECITEDMEEDENDYSRFFDMHRLLPFEDEESQQSFIEAEKQAAMISCAMAYNQYKNYMNFTLDITYDNNKQPNQEFLSLVKKMGYTYKKMEQPSPDHRLRITLKNVYLPDGDKSLITDLPKRIINRKKVIII